mgnify:CR=1 FL=1
MKNYTSKKTMGKIQKSVHEYMSRRQAANYERFMQEKADVFQVTEGKEQAMFWAMTAMPTPTLPLTAARSMSTRRGPSPTGWLSTS